MRAALVEGPPLYTGSMGLRVTSTFAALLSMTGCSLIYNPSDLPNPATDAILPDVTPDMPVIPVDADPALLEITDVSPREILEGQGIDNSRRAVIVVTGVNIVSGATIQVTAHAGEAATPKITVHNEDVVVSTDGLNIAVPITVDVDEAIGPGVIAGIRLDVSVTQPTAGEPITKTLSERATPDDPILTLRGLREQLGGGTLTIDLSQPRHEFSKIDATAITFTGNANIPVIEAVSSLKVVNPISVNANNQTAGFGGANGGAGGPGGLLDGSTGSLGTGTGGGTPSGGGGSFGEEGMAGPGAPGEVAGQASLPTLVSPNRGSGGAGGNGQPLGAAGGNGGGGGGTIALTAGGDLTIGAITANGGAATGGGLAGGGGSGGAVLLRAGNTIAITGAGISAIGGTSSGNGKGGNGRVRFDAGLKATSVTASTPLPGHRGAMLDVGTPLIVRDQTPELTFQGLGMTGFSYTVENADASLTRAPVSLEMPGNNTLIAPITVDLFRGVNVFCVRVEGANGSVATGKNCMTIVFVP